MAKSVQITLCYLHFSFNHVTDAADALTLSNVW